MSIEALEQPEQEPVGVSYNEGVSFFKTLKHGTKLYATPPKREWVVLTADEISVIVRESARGSATRRDGSTSERIARAIEASLKEKNHEMSNL